MYVTSTTDCIVIRELIHLCNRQLDSIVQSGLMSSFPDLANTPD